MRKRLSAAAYRAAKYLDSLIPGPPIPADRPGNAVLIHAGRSGSTVLGHMLGAHPGIFWDHEVFNPRHGLWRRQADAEAFLHRRMGRARRRFYGFELQLHDRAAFGRDWPELVDLLADIGFTHFIVLRRRNVLRSIVSRTAVHFGAARHLRGGGTATLHRVVIDPELTRFSDGRRPLIAGIDAVEAGFEAVVAALRDREALSLTYEEDIAADPATAYGKTCAFLGLAPAPVAAGYARVNPYPLSDMIENYDEVAALLAGTPHAWMLEE